MTCSADARTCALERIADAVTAQPTVLQEIVSGLLPIVIGAVLALASSWLVARRQDRVAQNVRYDERLTEALVDLMRSLGDQVARVVAAQRARDRGVQWSVPTAKELQLRAETVRMIARERDAAVTKQLKYAIDRVTEKVPLDDQVVQLRVMGQILRAWRDGSHDSAIAEQRLTGLALVT